MIVAAASRRFHSRNLNSVRKRQIGQLLIAECFFLLHYIGFRNSVSTASSFRGVSAKRRPGGTLWFLFQSKGHTICKNGINCGSAWGPVTLPVFKTGET